MRHLQKTYIVWTMVIWKCTYLNCVTKIFICNFSKLIAILQQIISPHSEDK